VHPSCRAPFGSLPLRVLSQSGTDASVARLRAARGADVICCGPSRRASMLVYARQLTRIRSQAIDKRQDAIVAPAAQVLRSPSSVGRPTFVE
jgi:hypothetical protein